MPGRNGLHARKRLLAAHHRHRQVKHHTFETVRFAAEDIQPARAVLGEQDGIAKTLQRLAGDLADDMLVIDNQNQAGAAEIPGLWSRRGRLCSRTPSAAGNKTRKVVPLPRALET